MNCPFGSQFFTTSNVTFRVLTKHLIINHYAYNRYFSLLDIISNSEFYYNSNDTVAMQKYINQQLKELNIPDDLDITKIRKKFINIIEKSTLSSSIINKIQTSNKLKEFLSIKSKRHNSSFVDK